MLDAPEETQTKARRKPEESQKKANIKNKKEEEEKENTNPSIIPPDDFKPNETNLLKAKELKLDDLEVQYQTEQFIEYAKDRAEKNPKKAYTDLQKAFGKWLVSPFFRPMPEHVRRASQPSQAPATHPPLSLEEIRAHNDALKQAEAKLRERRL